MERNPTYRDVVIHIDGGARPTNPGPAGFGVIITNTAGHVLARTAAYIGKTTNNVAEYHGLIAGLELARVLGATNVRLRSDSRLLVEQVKGNWRVNNAGLLPLMLEARALAAKFHTVAFEWIPREDNIEADALATSAILTVALRSGERPR